MNSSVINYYDNNIELFYNGDKNCAVNNSIRNGRKWEKNILTMYEKILNKESVVLDIGANLGTHTVPLSLLCKEVIAFEPQKKIYNLLKKTIEFNNIDNVILYNNIVSSNANEDKLLEFLNTDCGRAGLKQYRPRLDGIISYEKSMTIDSLKLVKCDFIKIDVEGSEFEVLSGGHETIEKYKPVILLETWNTKRNLMKLHMFSIKYNYRFSYISSNNYILTKK